MSSTPSQALPALPDVAQISRIVSSIVLGAKENNSLSSLTPRLVRSEAENKLGVPSGTLDASKYKALVKRTIHDAMQREQTSGVNGIVDSKMKKKVSKPKVGESRRSSTSKSKEIITDSEREDEPKLSTLQRKVKSDTRADSGEEKLVRSNSKTKSSKAGSKANKDTSSSTKGARSGPKHKLPPVHVAQGDSNEENPDTVQRAASSRPMADNESDSMSSLADEPPKKKARGKPKNSEAGKPQEKLKRPKPSSHTLSKDEETVKRLKSLVVACGVRKQWTRELDGLDTSAQIAHIRKILSDLGMAGRLSMEQAREIRAQRELAQELDDVQKFERAIVSGTPFQTESTRRRVVKGDGTNADDANDGSDPGSESTSDHEPPKVNNARRSIMAFLQDQSSDGD
ncbi:hypothetical protein BJV74DRAFT_885881 [Russula compacta]|nr:hypothetical protein BJV74DRAFT_885881 [Russula compacta]